eukprot:TRINITY_DN37407_c0_g1_i1.p1 TRINITY_DN37407_c0_g1~~TRINITY_DN37407_c0_g1_i1.p1  ORF type:complete len:1297 (+),score=378.53 TRINITY_DN37407_c0_g1_i1:44-3934(+)
MLVLRGNAHASEAQVKKVLSLLNSRLSEPVKQLCLVTMHYIELKEGSELSDEARAMVDKCLEYGYHLDEKLAGASPYSLTVLPRSGTTTPWSSKATEILALCLHPSPVSRIEHGVAWKFDRKLTDEEVALIKDIIHDRMTQTILPDGSEATHEMLFSHSSPKELRTVPLNLESLNEANRNFGLALQADEIEYIIKSWPRDPTDAELMMFAQVNSEHCRHKIFNASWTLDGEEMPRSLFQMIKNTHANAPEGVLSAYKDNAAVLKGHTAQRFFSDANTHEYKAVEEPVHIVCKVETHNHPTAISPFAGAATGSGGEIRDEGATGIGGKPKAGMCGFSVSHLLIPEAEQPWEDKEIGKPKKIASALQIMLDAPIGASRFNNEFGRPAVNGYFRSFLQTVKNGDVKGYHKPIMLAGGLGNIRDNHIEKKPVGPGCHVVVLGGPAMLIGLGGGAASSMAQGSAAEDVDFASVQRDNAELERRCQEVIDACWALGDENPILCIHDVGAGGLSNAIPEVLHDSGNGGVIHLRKVPSTEMGMSPMEIWCNEAQERYVIACNSEGLARIEAICKRERCIYGVVGQTTEEQRLVVVDELLKNNTVDLPMSTLFGKPPKMSKSVTTNKSDTGALDFSAKPDEALVRVLSNPTVASKNFLITIGDRSVTGLVSRDQMVGKWQVPLADVAVTCSSYDSYHGEAMANGERTPVAVIDGPSSAGLAVGEALTNILAADVEALKDVRFSANWMVNSGSNEEDYSLYRTVEKIGMDLSPKLGIAIPVGKDSMSMKSIWKDEKGDKKVAAPLSVVITAFAPVRDVRNTITPDLKAVSCDTVIVMVDLALGARRLGGSILAQCFKTMGTDAPDMVSTDAIVAFSKAMTKLREGKHVLAYHDRSDGGLASALTEMCIAGHMGIDVNLGEAANNGDVLSLLFNEELGVALQVRASDIDTVKEIFVSSGLDAKHVAVLGKVTKEQRVILRTSQGVAVDRKRVELHRIWAETSYRMQAMRDNAECAKQEFDVILDEEDPGLSSKLTFDIPKPMPIVDNAPSVAILREQGVNGHVEMAWAFRSAGFRVHDVHMSDVLTGATTLDKFRGVVSCGGFSYGDTLGAGRGWASTIKGNPQALTQFKTFFHRPDTFALGICNGCQMLGSLWDLVPGAAEWPTFTYNESTQFEARVSMVKVQGSKSVFFNEMEGSVIPVAVSHGEGRAEFRSEADQKACAVPLRYVDTRGQTAKTFPYNPNGSPEGIAGVCSADGRVTALMPHPERVLRTFCNSWTPDHEAESENKWGDYSPWLQMFVNARKWCN